MQESLFEKIPDGFLLKWQEIADLVANIMNVPAALIMKTENEMMEVFTSSATDNNPYKAGDKEHRYGLYCEKVIKTQKKLHIPNALKDKNWNKNPDIKLGMIAYLGYPINFPNNIPFGTICVLDNKERHFTAENEKLLLQFKKVIELDLALIFSLELEGNYSHADIVQKLSYDKEEYQVINEELEQSIEELEQTNEELLAARRRVEESEETYRNLFQNAQVGLFRTGISDGKILESNKQLAVMFGYDDQDEFIAEYKTSGNYVDQGVREQMLEMISENGSIQNFEARFYRKDKSIFWARYSARIFPEKGWIEGVAEDITEKKQAIETLRNSEARFQKMLGVVPDMISIQSPEMDILYSNCQGFAQVSANRRILNTKCHKTYRDLDEICPDCLAKSVLETRQPLHKETRLSDGKWYDIRVIPILDKDNNVEMFMEWVRDITENKQAEEKLKSNYELLRIAGKTARFGGWSVDMEKSICTWSDAVADIHEAPHGYAPPVQEGINFYAPEWRKKITQVFNDCAGEGIPYDEEMEIITAKGKRLWVRTIGRAVKDQNGKISKVNGSFQDITVQKKAEEALRRSEEKFRSYIDFAPDGVFLANNNGKYTEVNRAASDITGYSEQELLNMHIADILQESELEKGLRHFREVNEKGAARADIGFVTKSGENRFWNIAAVKLSDNRFLGFVNDATERKNAEGALRQSEEKMHSIYRVAPTGIGIVEDRILKEVNPRICEMTGYTREELLGKDARILYPSQEDYDFVGKEKYEQISKKGTGAVETRWQKKDGSIINILLASTPIDLSDHAKGITFTALDISERKNIENELKEKTSFLSTLMETSPVGIVTVDKTGNITYANKRAEQILGLTKEKITSITYDAPLWNHTDLDGSPLPDEKQPFNIVKKSLKTVLNIQHGITWPDGNVVILSINATPIKNNNGEFNGMIASIEDISEFKQAEEALRESENRFREVLENSFDSAYRRDLAANAYDYISPSFEQLTGYSTDKLMLMSIEEYLQHIHPEDINRVMEFVNTSMNVNRDLHFVDYRFLHKDGKYRWFGDQSTIVDDENGKPRYRYGSVQDITERKQADEALKKSEEKYRHLLQNLHAGVVVHAADTGIRYANEQASHLLGLSIEKMIGKTAIDPAWRFLQEDLTTLPVEKYPVQYVITNKMPIREQVLGIHRYETNDLVWVLINAFPEFDTDGLLRQVVVTFIDITKRKKAEEEISLSAERLKEAELIGQLGHVDWVVADQRSYWSEEIFRIYELNPKLGVPGYDEIMALHVPEDVKRLEKAVIDALQKGKDYELDLVAVMPSGKEKNLHIIGRPIKDSEGNVTNIRGIVQDITQRKQAEESLRLANDIVSNIQLGMYVYHLEDMNDDRTLRMISANPATEAMTGVKVSDIIGKTLDENFPLLRDKGFPQRFAEVVRNGKPRIFEDIVYGDNRVIQACFSVKAFPLPQNHLGVAFENITEKVQAQNKIAENNNLLKLAQEIGNVGSWELDFLTNKVTWSDHTYTIYEENPDSFKVNFENIISHYPDGEKEKVLEALNKTITQKKDLLIEHEIVTGKGKTRFVSESGRLILSADGKPLKLIGSVADITKRKKMLRELVEAKEKAEENELKVRSMFENTQIGILFCDTTGKILEANPAILNILGSPSIEASKKVNLLTFKPLQEIGFAQNIEKCINEKNIISEDIVYKSKWGKTVFIKYYLVPVVVNEKVIGVWANLNNLTDLYLTQNQLILAKEKAQESDKLKTAFLNNISHEIRTPLNGILGFGNLLLDEDIPKKEKEEMLGRVEQSGNRLMKTVTDYMDMAQIVSGTMKVHKSEFLLQPFFEKVIEKTTLLCAGKNLDFSTDFVSVGAGLILDSDPELIGKILHYLLDNAIKFTTAGSIACGYRLKEGFVEFLVQDTGKGIAPEMLNAIFDVFTQEDTSDTRGYEGSGLGLSIANGLVKLLGGAISATSEKGKGSIFAFTVPYSETHFTQNTPPETEINAPVAVKPLVLVAEDEESNYLYMQAVLKKARCEYLLAKTGKEAVAMCKQYPDISLVLMDIKMPVMNGIEATKIIRGFRPYLPIIATTAYVQTGDEQRFLAAGCDGYLPKPIKKEKLLALFQKYVRS
jgi:PAS domain S-box-containing protein